MPINLAIIFCRQLHVRCQSFTEYHGRKKEKTDGREERVSTRHKTKKRQYERDNRDEESKQGGRCTIAEPVWLTVRG